MSVVLSKLAFDGVTSAALAWQWVARTWTTRFLCQIWYLLQILHNVILVENQHMAVTVKRFCATIDCRNGLLSVTSVDVLSWLKNLLCTILETAHSQPNALWLTSKCCSWVVDNCASYLGDSRLKSWSWDMFFFSFFLFLFPSSPWDKCWNSNLY